MPRFGFGLADVGNHVIPDFAGIMGAVDAGAVHAGGDEVADQGPAIFGSFCRQGHHDTRPRLGRTKNPPCVIGQERITVEEALRLGIRDEFICRFMANPAEGGHDGIQIGNRPGFAASQGGQAQGQEGALDFPQVMAAQS